MKTPMCLGLLHGNSLKDKGFELAEVRIFQRAGTDVAVRNSTQPLRSLGSIFTEQPVRVCPPSWPACWERAFLRKPGTHWRTFRNPDCENISHYSGEISPSGPYISAQSSGLRWVISSNHRGNAEVCSECFESIMKAPSCLLSWAATGGCCSGNMSQFVQINTDFSHKLSWFKCS